ncbi:hypothetical protein BTO14_01075 [Polaribacter butkevichii]|uniref:Uncharacterized protein n=2 Tax=Polaribacter butkevichii TaxID=218490 RepID=A0A2P6CAQ2_9FLAO|nr:hypothetical protein BTO14_01075 [Polaribacter butkevichii]
MRTNSFTKNMSKKSNKELETIFNEKEKYTVEAIQAVIWELENRNLIEKTAISVDETLKKSDAVNAVISTEKKENNESPFEELELPFLYSKKAIQGFTIFFSTIFGAFLLMQNLKEMNKPKARIQTLTFGIVYTILSAIILNYLPKTFFITLLFNLIGYVILTEYFWNKHIGKDLAFQKKQIWQPLATSIFIVLALILLLLLPQLLNI